MDKKYTVLIVDDDEFLLDMYSLKFRESGFNVEVAHKGTMAIEKLKEGLVPDVMLLDIVMPEMDGFEVLRELKKEGLAKGSSLVILSNLGQKEDIERGHNLGADDYLVKAYLTPKEVVEKVEALIKNKK
jgi:DNA-binding response OmpR family regulator